MEMGGGGCGLGMFAVWEECEERFDCEEDKGRVHHMPRKAAASRLGGRPPCCEVY